MTQTPQDQQHAGNDDSGAAETASEASAATTADKDTGPADDLVTTHHSITIDGAELGYSVTAGRMVLRLEGHTDDKFDGLQPKAEVFVTAYTADSAEPA